MMYRALSVGWALGVFVAFTSVAFAGHDEPAKAAKMQVSFVTGYQECLAGDVDSSTDHAAFAACTTATPNKSACGLGGVGSGKATLSVKDGDIGLKISVKGIQNCDGKTLCTSILARTTSHDCGGNVCTTMDVTPPLLSCCVVAAGKCTIKTTALTGMPGLFGSGTNLGIELLRCGLVCGPNDDCSGDGLDMGRPPLTCGLLVP